MDSYIDTKIPAFTDHELKCIEALRHYELHAQEMEAEKIEQINKLLQSVVDLAALLSSYPSINFKSFLMDDLRTPQTLVDTLCTSPPDGRLLVLPTKVVVGKAFLVAKFQSFSAIVKIVTDLPESALLVDWFHELALNVMFAIMTEDVYIALLDDNYLDERIKEKVAFSLTELWTHHIDRACESFAPVLSRVWTAREDLAPIFGTMLGASELFLLSMELDTSWSNFLLARLAEAEAGQALEEFLFGISYEEIVLVREDMRRRGISSISRSEVRKLVAKKNFFDLDDPRRFFTSYTKRRNNAEARKRLNVSGPTKTLEDFYILFLFESSILL